ncbi:Golgi-associated plant pathogenesis-related protein 1 [Orchesella cincta]|uniref:Golgi-associated plant pathogenesis-related protein 1 n=1 Tax=Orchesella cincta TaxID=48709 RepID=A0A1D2MZZ8_ORCCI|nr:Golgi-associated plant pathogenesis-related protein 1 [Orchesella cincta]
MIWEMSGWSSFVVLIFLSSMAVRITGQKEYQRAGLEQHNMYRARHGVPDMIMSVVLNDLAERCAQWMVDHVKAAKGAADAFYAEITTWNFYHPKGIFSHFGQAVWKGSTQLGVGVANGKSGMCAVIKYYPPGNLPELWSNLENVKLPYIEEKARSIYDQQYKRSDMVVKLGSKGTMTIPKSPALLLSLAWLTMFCSKMGPKTLLLLTLIPFIAFLINPTDAAVLEYQTVGQNAHNSYRSDHETPRSPSTRS